MSDLYNHLYQTIRPKRYAKGGDMPLELFELGMALEEGLKSRLVMAHGETSPGEFQTAEGIYYTPDLLVFNGRDILGEVKLTFMSIKGIPWKLGHSYTEKDFDEKFDKYWTQIKCCCKHLNTRYARLFVFFVNEAAPWKGKSGNNALRCWDVEFTQKELDKEWDWVWGHAKEYKLLGGLR